MNPSQKGVDVCQSDVVALEAAAAVVVVVATRQQALFVFYANCVNNPKSGYWYLILKLLLLHLVQEGKIVIAMSDCRWGGVEKACAGVDVVVHVILQYQMNDPVHQ